MNEKIFRKKKRHDDEHIDETWLIPYADLLTLLLALFIVLFASSTVDIQRYNAMRDALNAAFKGGAGLTTGAGVVEMGASENIVDYIDVHTDMTELVNLTQLKQQLDEYIKQNRLNMELETRLLGNYLTITIRDRALFNSGSAAIKPEFRGTVTAIGDILVEYPEYDILIAGHTDNVPISTAEFADNWDLSSRRALNFMKLLLLNEKLAVGRFSAIGYGEYRPVAANETEEGRALNRRVEVVITRHSKQNVW